MNAKDKDEAFEKRFWSKVDKSGECWLWTASKNKGGYGQTYWKGKVMRSHRVAYELTHGPVPEGMDVGLLCENHACTRPVHLFLRSKDEKITTMLTKRGRGEQARHARLTEEQVLDIRRQYSLGNVSLTTLAEAFGVTAGNIHAIVNRKSWTHL